MGVWNSGITKWLTWLGQTSWQVSLLIVLVLLVRVMWGQRMSARWRFALWSLVCVRILIPWGPASPLSLDHWARTTLLDQPQSVSQPPVAPPLSDTLVTPHLDETSQNPPQTLFLLWLSGAGLLAGIILWHYVSLTIRVQDGYPIRSQLVSDLLIRCRRRLGVRTPIRCVATNAVSCPALLGWLRPQLLIPKDLFHVIGRRQLIHIFLHELTHLKRGDIMLGWIMALCQILHWFNPLVWLAFYLMRADREMACDHKALSMLKPHQTRQYGLTLLQLLEHCQPVGPLPALAGISPNLAQLKRRVRTIACFEPPIRSLEAGPALMFALLAIVGLTRMPQATSLPAASIAPQAAWIETVPQPVISLDLQPLPEEVLEPPLIDRGPELVAIPLPHIPSEVATTLTPSEPTNHFVYQKSFTMEETPDGQSYHFSMSFTGANDTHLPEWTPNSTQQDHGMDEAWQVGLTDEMQQKLNEHFQEVENFKILSEQRRQDRMKQNSLAHSRRLPKGRSNFQRLPDSLNRINHTTSEYQSNIADE